MRRLTVAIAGLLVAASAFLYAGTTGKIVGTVVDQTTGNPLIGADVVLEGTGMGGSTDADGYYSILNVPPGTYRLSVYYVGYAPLIVEGVRVRIDRTTTQTVKMSSELVEGREVVVEAERAVIELDRTHSSSVVNSETVDLLPVTEIEEVIELQAGVVSNNGQLHFRGGRAREVAYIIDGMPVTNAFSQSGGSNVNVETNMIEELEVISGTFNAEYGQAQSGVINIVTKKPARDFSGSVQTYIGEWISSQDETFLGVDDVDPFAEKDVQFSLSGPIINDKLGFSINGRFNDWESLDWYERRFNLIDGWRISAYQKWVQDYGEAGEGEGVLFVPDSLQTGDLSRGPLRTGTSSSLNAKLIFTPFNSVTLSYQGFFSFDEYDGPPDGLGTGADQFRRYQPDGSGTTRDWEWSHFVRFSHVPSETFFYNLGFSWQHNDAERYYFKDNTVSRYPGQAGIMPLGAAFSGFSAGTTDGLYTGADGRGYRDQYVLLGNFNWQIDKHNLIKAGAEVKVYYQDVYGQGFRVSPEWQNNALPNSPLAPGDLTFDEYWDLVVGYWQTWEDSFRTTRFIKADPSEANLFRDFSLSPIEYSAYIQDKLEMGDIIINGGVRLDVFDPNEQVPINYTTESTNLGRDINLKDAETKWQVSPRLGISFPISANGAFHASYGHFFQMPSFGEMFNEPLVNLTPLQLDGRRLGNADLKAERTIAYEIGLQQAITPSLAVDVTAYYKDIENLLGIEQLTTLDRITYTRYVNRDYGNTRGLSVGFTKRGDRVNGGANYSLSFANGSSSNPDELALITVSNQIGGESGVFGQRKILPLEWDQRHAGKAYLNFVQPGSWSIGLTGFVETGLPYDPTFVARFDLNEREYRKSAQKPTAWSIDLKAKKNFQFGGLESILFLKVDNLFDHLNADDVFPSTGQADQLALLPDEKDLLESELRRANLFTFEEITLNPDFFSPPRKVEVGFEVRF